MIMLDIDYSQMKLIFILYLTLVGRRRLASCQTIFGSFGVILAVNWAKFDDEKSRDCRAGFLVVGFRFVPQQKLHHG